MLEVTAGNVLSFVELLGGLQYLSFALPFKRRHSAEFSGWPVYSYITDFVKSHFHTVVADHVRSVVWHLQRCFLESRGGLEAINLTKGAYVHGTAIFVF
jgi:hypothetical protein